MSGLNWRVILVGLCIASLGHLGWTDTDMPADTPPPVVKKPVKKHPKKHSKPVKKATTEEAPKVLTLSNDDLPQRHRNYGASDSNTPDTTTSVPMTNASATTHAAAPTPAAAAPAATDPYAALRAVAPRIAPSSDPTDVPTPDASAVHSTGDLNKPLPTTSIH